MKTSPATANQRLLGVLAGLALLGACAQPSGGGSASGSGGAQAPGSGGSSVGGSSGIGGGHSGGSSGSGGAGTGGATNPEGTGGRTAGSGGSGSGGATLPSDAGMGDTSGAGGNRPGTGGSTGVGGRVDAGTGTGGGAPSDAGTGANHWVGTWTGAPQLTETANLPPATLTSSTLRQIVHASLGGSQIRVRFSNEFGNGSVTINQAHAAVCKANPVDSTIDTATDQALSFSGMASTTIAQGTAVWSDPINFTVAALSNLSITVAFGNTPSDVTGHPGSRTTSYLQAGGSVSAASMTSAQVKTADHWYILSGVDVMAPAAAKGLVILGDSISDGKGSTTNGNDRWPDDLARRLAANAPTSEVAVMNQGIGGNTVTTGGLGPTAVSRYSRDVLGQSGVRWIIVFEGVNDIGAGIAASSVTAAFASMITQAHAKNLLIYGATITPFGANAYYSVANETARQAVNTYIRSGAFDAFIDMDAAVRDSSTPPKLQAPYDSGDGLHPTPAGHQKLADTVDLTLLTK